jgi:hypothetical protein
MTTTTSTSASVWTELPSAIFRRWAHACEEDAGGVRVYRPAGFPFPPLSGRDGFEIAADGRFIAITAGRWTFLGNRRVAVSFAGAVKAVFTFEIAEVDDTVLRIRRAA